MNKVKKTKKNPRAAKKQKRNTAESRQGAQDMAETFHGRSQKKVVGYAEHHETPTDLANLGKLRTLEILTPLDEEYTLEFSGVHLACTPDGGQLYFVGGNQTVNLAGIGIDAAGKDHADLGECLLVSYETKKGFHHFEDIEYGHNFGEDNGNAPSLHYDTRNKLLYLTGGTYRVAADGIEN